MIQLTPITISSGRSARNGVGLSDAIRFGDWVCQKSDDETWALHLTEGTTLHLTGELHHGLWAEPNANNNALFSLIPRFAHLANEVRNEGRPLTVGDLLHGTGYRRISVELTGRCNERCLHCYASSSPEVETSLDSQTTMSVIRDAGALGFKAIQFTGGDPLLSPNLLAGVELASELRFCSIEIHTNGLALRQDLAERLVPFGVQLAFSVYSHNAEVHDSVTMTPGSWARTVQAIRLARQLGIVVRVSSVIRAENRGDVDGIKQFLGQLGVPEDRICFGIERAAGRGNWQGGTETLDQESHDAFAAHGSGREFNGKVAVTYTGTVVPCFFDRGTVLGHVGPHGGLRAIFERRVRRISMSSMDRPLAMLETKLGCSECQLRHSLLTTAQIDGCSSKL